MSTKLNRPNILERVKRLFGVGSHVHGARAADAAKERGAELTQQLIEHKMHEQARQTTQAGNMTVPAEWNQTMLSELLEAYQDTNDPVRADQMSVRAWGLVRNAARLFAQDGHALTDADIDALKSLLSPDESPATTSLFVVVERLGIAVQRQEELHVKSLKAQGQVQAQ